MALTYDLGKSFGIPANADGTYPKNTYVSVSPSWVLAVVRLHRLVTWDRTTNQSVDKDVSYAASEAGRTLVITSDCLQVTTSDSKGSHVTNLDASLIGGEINYLVEIMPGDWILCWMVNDETKAADIVKRIKNSQAVNDFSDGLKFVGRVQGIRKKVDLNRDVGMLTTRYSLQAHGFCEFDSAVLFIPQLAVNSDTANTWMAKVFGGLDKLIGIDPNAKASGKIQITGTLQANTLIVGLTDILLGSGLPTAITNPAGKTKSIPGVQALQAVYGGGGIGPDDSSPRYAYAMPTTVGTLLGREASNNTGIMAVRDILDIVIGVQSYQDAAEAGRPENIFTPDMPDNVRFTNKRFLNQPVLGSYLLQIPQLDGKTVWSVISQYLNSTVNEMYNCLRINPSGAVVPTLTVRQLPFTTPYLGGEVSSAQRVEQIESDSGLLPPTTPFLSLPRWVAPPGIIYNFDVGRSDAMRTNFVHMVAQSITQGTGMSPQQLYLKNPPLHDDLDIARNGLRPERVEVACSPQDTFQGPATWNKIRSDIVMGQQLTLTGQIVLQGIQDPICIGDNFEFGDGAVYHIEGVSHTCSIQGGNKTFFTVIQLTHGVNENGQQAIQDGDPSLLFAGTQTRELRQYDPKLTYSAENPSTEPLNRTSKGTTNDP